MNIAGNYGVGAITVQLKKQPDKSKRKLDRISIKAEEHFSVRFKIDQKDFSGTLKDFTSTGAQIAIVNDFETKLAVGQKILNIAIFANKFLAGEIPEGTICHKSDDGKSIQIGLRFHHQKNVDSGAIRGIREHGRFWIQNQFLPKAEVKNPLYLNDIIMFDVVNISKSGLKMSTSARNKSLLKGQLLRTTTIYLPLIGTLDVDCKIQYLEHSDGNRLNCGVMFLNLSRKSREKLTRYLIGFALYDRDKLLEDLKKYDQTSKQLKKFVNFGIAETEDEYIKVLKLRHDAYKRAGKVDIESDFLSMTDLYDQHSRIIFAKYGDRVIASMRLTYCSLPAHAFELEQSIKLPSKFRRATCVEASRACIAEDFQDSDVIHGLFEFSAGLALKFGVKWVISSCDESLLPLYKKLGFKRQGITFYLKTMSNIPHTFIAARTEVIRTSKGLNPIIWYFTYSNLANYLARLGFLDTIKLGPIRRTALTLGLIVLKIAKYIRR